MLNELIYAKVWVEKEIQSEPAASEIRQAVRYGKNRMGVPIDHDLLALQRWQIYTNIAPHFLLTKTSFSSYLTT
jgi:hypothetical protein